MQHSIVVDHLSKQYRIGEAQHGAMLRETLMNALKRPFRKAPSQTRSIWALRDVSFAVDRNEVVGLIGRNGAGKTTLLKLLSRITFPTSGKMTLRGRVASLVEVGTGFHPELSGRENIFLNGSILGLRRREIQENFDAIVEFSGVRKHIDTPIKRYSTGMRLRLGFAVAAHLSPDILLVDEVLAVGDAEFQKKCLDVLDRAGSSGRTVIFVSHNLEAVQRLCPRTIWIDEGRLRQDGKTRDVIVSYLQTVADSEQSVLDLSRNLRRSGTGEVRYTRFEVLDLDGKPKDIVQSGDTLLLRLSYEAESDVKSPHFGVMLFTDLGTLVAHLNTWSVAMETPLLKSGTGRVELSIDSLNLMPGRYLLTIYIERIGEGKSFDLLEHCVTLDVHSSGSEVEGRLLERRPGVVFFPSNWKRFED